jgi:cytochrome c biogenesis protein CcmG/thiol:disulfide interchange protein DsbE
MRLRTNLLTALALGAIALFAVGCGGSSRSSGSPPPDYAKALRGAPAPLAKLYSQDNQLLPGGEEAFERRLGALRGYPVVVNVWASWCGGCRFEFPMLQKLSARFGTQVAFVGLNSEDSEEFAAKWLDGAPVPYPSYTDPDRELAESLGPIRGLPATAFIDRSGEVVWFKQGAYREIGELEAEIKKYALGA